ncbi:MAG: nitroreductase family protein [Candidatus Methanosuratincola sp.]|jgi:nitroreductase|nr:nitroreductase family protein [Candidatus Methanosuratincola sp.]
MEVFEAILRRRSVRSYLPDPVPQEKLRRILEAGRLSPSAMNKQPWHFIVVTDPEKRKELAHGKFGYMLKEAPLVIVGCGDREASPKWYKVDTAIALQTMVIAATGEELGTCWVGSFDEAMVKETLKIPDRFEVVAMLAVGYPKEGFSLTGTITSVLRKKKDFGEIVSYNCYGESPRI